MRKETLTSDDLQWLAAAIDMAEEWRGEQVGNPDPAPLEMFDARIVRMKLALQRAKKTRVLFNSLPKAIV